MSEWWAGLTVLNQVFYAVAVFFSTIFIWQFASSVSSLGGDADGVDGADGADGEVGGDFDADVDMDGEFELEAEPGADFDDLVDDAPGLATFRLLSVRSILAFGTLFSWAGALYLPLDVSVAGAMFRALAWGCAGMLVVGLFFWLLPRLSEEGTSDPATAVGQTGQVYMDIPADGVGQIRVVYGGRLQFVRARSDDGQSIQAGVTVRVVGQLDSMMLQVRRIDGAEERA